MSQALRLSKVDLTLGQKVASLNWGLLLLLSLTAALGLAVLHSLSDGTTANWVERQSVRFAVGIVLMFTVALIDIRVWMRLAYAGYFGALTLLGLVAAVGTSGMGAQRWVDVGIVTLQPSELMKVALVVALARYFHEHTLEEVRRLRYLAVPTFMVLAPAALVLRQPDLGTAALLVLGGGAMFVLAGVRARIFVVLLLGALAAVPVAWQSLHVYQRARILTFLDPTRDPLGAGYHILQSKIALGAGGLFGRGYMAGTQSHLSFLPEMQTDFIFTTLAEEFGLVGALGLLTLYLLILAYGFAIALLSRNHFGRLLAMGVSMTFFIYFFINIAMVTGLLPVVGVPLPLVSYGGTAMVTLLVAFGLLMSVYVHREIRIPRRPGATVD